MIPFRVPAGTLSVLCLGAHPDDIEIGCGATLLALAETRDVNARFVIATGDGERLEEAIKAAPRFLPGAAVDVEILGHRDGLLPTEWGGVKQELEEIASATTTPDVVFAPRLDDAHQDHRLIAELVATVWRNSLVLRYEIPKWDGDIGRVTHYITFDPEIALRKVALLDECFPSQRDRDWWDNETFLGLMRLRGVESRARYAEGFVVDKAVLDVR